MKKRKVSSILLSLALAASLFTGCGGAEPAAGTETTPDAETEAAETETAPDTEAAAGDSGYKTTGEAYEIHYIASSVCIIPEHGSCQSSRMRTESY